MKPAILFAMPISQKLQDRLAERYEVLGPLDRANPLPIPEAARGARALITLGSLRTDKAMMDALPDLGLICCYGTGFEGVDRAEAASRGIKMTHAGDSNATSVAEFAMGLVIATARNLVRGDRMLRAGKWASLSLERVPITPGLAGHKLGIYGMGSIGLKIAQRAAAFEMEIGYHNRSRRTDVPYGYHGSLMELAAWSDVLVVAVRASAENRHAINAEVLDALGPNGFMVNISRGIAVDELALCEALETNRIAGAGLDVYQNEPHVPERFMALENVVLTPHMSALSRTAQSAQQKVLIDNLDGFFSGRPLSSEMPLA
ncbi:MAG: hydroxyacid dehydrogenase [Rubritepida sp.]|nr:hydroxyacid dehydrogenase [Rubritepida sp.]